VKIWYQSAAEMTATSPYRAALQSHADRVTEPETSVAIFGVEPGTWAGRQPSQLFGYPAIFHAALGAAFIRNAVRAERAGFDAFIIGTYIEPYLRELRAAVDIPVVSSLEAMLLVGCSTAHTMALITINQSLVWSLKLSIERHRLGARVGSVTAMNPELNEREIIGLLTNPGSYVERFLATAREAVKAHADAIIPAEGILAELVAAQGITNVDGAVVLDGVGIPVAYAQMLVKLWRTTGLRVGRRWHYARPTGSVIDEFVFRT
jgi:allantoin racemase